MNPDGGRGEEGAKTKPLHSPPAPSSHVGAGRGGRRGLVGSAETVGRESPCEKKGSGGSRLAGGRPGPALPGGRHAEEGVSALPQFRALLGNAAAANKGAGRGGRRHLGRRALPAAGRGLLLPAGPSSRRVPPAPGRPGVTSSSHPGAHGLPTPRQARCPPSRQSLPGRPPSSPCPAAFCRPRLLWQRRVNSPCSEAASSFEVLSWCLHSPTHARESTAQGM